MVENEIAALLRRIGCTFILLLCSLLIASSARAHGGGTPRLVNAGDGPYRIFVWTQPEPLRAGEIHISIAITEPAPEGTEIDDRNLSNELESVVQGAEIEITLAPVDESTAPIVILAMPSSVSEFFYEADLVLPADGLWDMRFVAEAELGSSEAGFEVDVLPARQINWLLLGGGAGLFVLLFVVLGVRRGNVQR